MPDYVRQLVEQVAFTARESELVDQSSGVSARLSISALELLHSNLERRAAMTGETTIFPRLSDFAMLLPAITGKVEMVYEGEQQGAEVVARKLIGTAVARAGATTRERRYNDVDHDDLDDMFSGRRVKKPAPPQQREEKPVAKSDP